MHDDALLLILRGTDAQQGHNRNSRSYDSTKLMYALIPFVFMFAFDNCIYLTLF